MENAVDNLLKTIRERKRAVKGITRPPVLLAIVSSLFAIVSAACLVYAVMLVIRVT